MEVRIQAIHFDATEKLQDFIQKKTAKLEKYCDDINKVEVSLKVVKPELGIPAHRARHVQHHLGDEQQQRRNLVGHDLRGVEMPITGRL